MSQLDGELRKIIRNLSIGQFSDPILRPQGIQIIKLLERHGGKFKPLEEVRNAIFGLLFTEEVNKRYSSWIQELKEKSYTEIVCQ